MRPDSSGPAADPSPRSAQFGIDPVRFSEIPPGGIDPDGFSVTGTYRDRFQSEEYPVIVEWRTGAHGAHGAFEQ